jgi:hypothetical protein
MKIIQSKKKQKSYYHKHRKTKYNHLRFLTFSFFMVIVANTLWFLKPQISAYSKNYFNQTNQGKIIASIQQPKLISNQADTSTQPEVKIDVSEQFEPKDTTNLVSKVKIDSLLINQKPDFNENTPLAVTVKIENRENDFVQELKSKKELNSDTINQVEKPEKSNKFESLAAQYYPKNNLKKENAAQSQFILLLDNLAQYPKNKKIMYQLMDEILEQKDHPYFKQVGEIKYKLSRFIK